MSPSQIRARDIGIDIDGEPGPLNAITDVSGVQIGMVTMIRDTADPEVCARTGVTAILPLGKESIGTTVPAGISTFNGNGEMTGSHWIRETGGLNMPIMLTNTHAVGTVHRGVIAWAARNRPDIAAQWMLPVVAETWDGYLNSINEPFLTEEDASMAIDTAVSGPVTEGSAGGGTGMNCYGFKGGNGTSSRLVELGGVTYTVGVFVQANFGSRKELRIDGQRMGDLSVPSPMEDGNWFMNDLQQAVPSGAGSVVVVVATDAPMIPDQCEALARRVPLGLARTGTTGSHFSGDIFIAFSTANGGALHSGFPQTTQHDVTLNVLSFVPWNWMDDFYTATVQAVEEAVLNALVANEDMIGRSGHTSYALPHDLVKQRLKG